MLVVNTTAGETLRFDLENPEHLARWTALAKAPETISAIGLDRGGGASANLIRAREFGPDQPTFEAEFVRDERFTFERIRMFVGEVEVRVTLNGRHKSQLAVRVELHRPGWRRHRKG
jgi:hypothetical protein